MNCTSEVNEAATVHIPQNCLKLVRDLVDKHGSQLYFFKDAKWLDLDPEVAIEFAGQGNQYKPCGDDVNITESGHACPLGRKARCLTTGRKPLRDGDEASRLKTIGLITDNVWFAEVSGTTLTRNHFLQYESQDCEIGSCELHPVWKHQLSASKTPDRKPALSLLGQGTESVLLLRVPGTDGRGDPTDIWTPVTSFHLLQSATNSDPDPSQRTGWGWEGFTDPTRTDEALFSQGRLHLRHIEDGVPIKIRLHSDITSDQHELTAIVIHPGWTQASA